jgi:anti-sigma-K factor RskA
MNNPRQRDEEQRREALATLKSLAESDTVATSQLARTAKRATDHFAARDAIAADGSVDAIELWGRRIGRALSLAGVIALAVYLYLTYFAK